MNAMTLLLILIGMLGCFGYVLAIYYFYKWQHDEDAIDRHLDASKAQWADIHARDHRIRELQKQIGINDNEILLPELSWYQDTKTLREENRRLRQDLIDTKMIIEKIRVHLTPLFRDEVDS